MAEPTAEGRTQDSPQTAATVTACPDIGLPLLHRGKVREVFDLGDQTLLLVATDRLSAFDVVFREGIPGKGRVLTRLSTLWFRATAGIAANHLLDDDVASLPVAAAHRRLLAGRSMVVRRARRVDVECVVRGYLAGSAWKEYQATGAVCGLVLPPGLRLNERLPEPIFTPAWKHDTGHDENIPLETLAARVGADLAGRLRDRSLELYGFAAARCAAAGILLADTKFEFGWVGETLTLIDELFTPDSSRFWPAERYRVGEPIDSLDKQPLRDYAASLGWNLEPPAPPLPPEVVAATAARYQEALRRVQQALAAAR
jgi:phosphoribosylaminoimidazole-succinocarboxamide synthase